MYIKSKDYMEGGTYSPSLKMWFKKKGIELYPYQKECVRFIKERWASYIALDMGMGKSLISIEATRRLGSTIVVCPAILKLNWKQELMKFGVKEELINIVTNKEVYKCQYNIVNYERLNRIKHKYYNMIIDEAHYCKNGKAQRSRDVKDIAWGIKGKLILLSGTPIKSRPEELYYQLKIMQDELSISWEKFHRRYCGARRTRFGWWTKGATRKEELAIDLKRLMYRATKESKLN